MIKSLKKASLGLQLISNERKRLYFIKLKKKTKMSFQEISRSKSKSHEIN